MRLKHHMKRNKLLCVDTTENDMDVVNKFHRLQPFFNFVLRFDLRISFIHFIDDQEI